MDQEPLRAVVYANVTDIPGNPQRRHNTLSEAFCEHVLNREFCMTYEPSCYDHVHIPPDFDSHNPLKRWFIIDLNVKEPLSRESVVQIPHLVYLASYQQDKWQFIARDKWKEKATKRADTFTWGGRREQNKVAEMRAKMRNQENTTDVP
ncbi:hypothetical protein BJY00DRAFT_285740 [Aspergillus carlsbadensis]|nr:hypothetical protein BJY00DRAFT_285740 [Aspergillus carlsbadensis]